MMSGSTRWSQQTGNISYWSQERRWCTSSPQIVEGRYRCQFEKYFNNIYTGFTQFRALSLGKNQERDRGRNFWPKTSTENSLRSVRMRSEERIISTTTQSNQTDIIYNNPLLNEKKIWMLLTTLSLLIKYSIQSKIVMHI